MIAALGLAISFLALGVSAVAAWLTLVRRGQILMTQPTVIYFGPDGGRDGVLPTHQKVFFRALIHSTEKKGLIVENMFIRLRRGETRQNFNVWVLAIRNFVGEAVFLFRTLELLPIIIFCHRQICAVLSFRRAIISWTSLQLWSGQPVPNRFSRCNSK